MEQEPDIKTNQQLRRELGFYDDGNVYAPEQINIAAGTACSGLAKVVGRHRQEETQQQAP